MKTLLVVIVIGLIAQSDTTSEQGTPEVNARLKAAREVYQYLRLMNEPVSAEEHYLWSTRVVEASNGNEAEIKRHHELMTELLERIRALNSVDRANPLEFKIVKYYVAEAKHWLDHGFKAR